MSDPPHVVLAQVSRKSLVNLDMADRHLAHGLGWRPEWIERAIEADASPDIVGAGPMLRDGGRAQPLVSGSIGPVIVHPEVMDAPRPRPWMSIGRGSPFNWRHGLRADSATYREDLWSRMRANDHAVLGWLRSITIRHTLVCDCSSERCHGRVVLRAWRWLRDRDRAHARGE